MLNEENRTTMDRYYGMHCRDKLGRKIQKGMLEKVTRQLPRTTEGQDRASQEPGEPVFPAARAGPPRAGGRVCGKL